MQCDGKPVLAEKSDCIQSWMQRQQISTPACAAKENCQHHRQYRVCRWIQPISRFIPTSFCCCSWISEDRNMHIFWQRICAMFFQLFAISLMCEAQRVFCLDALVNAGVVQDGSKWSCSVCVFLIQSNFHTWDPVQDIEDSEYINADFCRLFTNSRITLSDSSIQPHLQLTLAANLEQNIWTFFVELSSFSPLNLFEESV